MVSFEYRLEDGAVAHPFGKDATGLLVYTAEGYMSGAVMSGHRPLFKNIGLLNGSPEEKASAFDGYLHYGGRYSVQGNKVTHHVEVSLFPNWVGKEQVRYFEFEGDHLILSTDTFRYQNKKAKGFILWRPA